VAASREILIVGTGSGGGVGRYEVLLARGLREAGAVRGWQIREQWRRAHPAYLQPRDAAAERPHPALEDRELSMGGLAMATLRQVVRRRPAVVVFTHPNLARLLPAAKLASARTRYVVCTHGIEVWDPPSTPVRLGLTRADRVVASASYNAERLRANLGIDPAVIPLALDPSWRPDGGGTASGGSGPARLLTVTRLSKADGYKGVDRVIEVLPGVIEAVGPISYTIVGDGDDEQRLRQLAAERGVQDQVHFAGFLDDDEMARAYRDSDVFALPSTGEGFGLVLLEAMAFGKPIVAAAVGGPLDIVVDGVTGRLISTDEELAAALVELLGDRDAASRMGAAGRARVTDAFSFGAYVERWTALIDAALEGDGGRRCAA
jgi:phosphatidyl-myo-inositol dimannoside synthase